MLVAKAKHLSVKHKRLRNEFNRSSFKFEQANSVAASPGVQQVPGEIFDKLVAHPGGVLILLVGLLQRLPKCQLDKLDCGKTLPFART